jgi:ATP-dependent DNA helicase RecQ
VGEIACDEALFERLRQLRKRLADERSVPSYIIFSDVALRQMARAYPTDAQQFAAISGVGDRKLQEFGSIFLAEISDFLKSNPRQIFADNSFAPLPAAPLLRAGLSATMKESLARFRGGETIEQIAARRNLSPSTIYGHLADAILAGEKVEISAFLSADQKREISGMLEKIGGEALAPVFEALGGRYDYGKLKLVRAAMALDRSGNAGR